MFYENGSWGKAQFYLQKGMSAELLRRRVIADNLANVDVPHFKRSEVTFESQLKRALDSELYAKENALPTRMSQKRHIPFFSPLDPKGVSAKVNLDYLSTMRNDGNNVDPEHEVSQAVKNQLRYQAMANSVNHNFRLLNIVMRAP